MSTIKIDNKQLSNYLIKLHKRVFKILPMYEESCDTLNDYIDGLTRELLGNSKLFFGDELLIITGTINGLSFHSHKAVRSDILKVCNILAEMQERVK